MQEDEKEEEKEEDGRSHNGGVILDLHAEKLGFTKLGFP